MKIRKLLFVLFVAILGYLSGYGQTIYRHNFGTVSTELQAPNYPYVTGASATVTMDTNLTSTGWTNSSGVWSGGFFGSGGNPSRAISLSNSSGTPTITLTLNVAAGYQMSVTQFNFWRVRTALGAQTITSMTIGGITVYTPPALDVPTFGAPIGVTNVSNAVTNLTGTVAVVISLGGATGTGRFSLDDFELIGTVTRLTRTTKQAGDWYNANTWTNNNIPSSAEDALISHAVTNVGSGATITRNSGTTTTIDSGGTLATGAFAYNNNGTTNVNGTFQLDASGSVTGNNFVYGAASTLVLNTTVSVANTDQYWPTSGPFNVTVMSGGLTMNTANRTVNGVFQTAAGVTLTSSVLTLNGTCQINAGGSFVNAPPTFGSSSTLVYNQGGSASVGFEWTGATAPPTAGLGAPQNVTVQNTTTLTMPAATRSMAGDLNINSGTFVNNTNNSLYIGGNWNRVSTAFFTPNTGKVFFSSGIANTIHTVTVNGGGTETFNTIEIQFTGNLRIATGTNITVSGVNGVTLNTTNATSSIDLNGQTLTVTGGGNLGWSTGARRITSTIANGVFAVSGSLLTVSLGGAGTLSTDTNTIVRLSQAFNPGSLITTINGTLQINSGGSIATNAPIYGNSSLLQYNTTGSYNRNLEWTSDIATIGTTPGYPHNVQISNNTVLNYYNAATGPRGMNGNLVIDAGSSLSFGATSTVGSLSVIGNVTNAGTLTLGAALGDDLRVGGDYSNTGAGTFNGNNRAIWFTKLGTQTVSSATALTIPFVVTSGGGTTVQLLSDVVISSSNSGVNVISFGNANDVIDINGRNLTIGATNSIGTIGGAGTFKGSATSNLTILGSTASTIGTLSFTSGFQNLGTFTMNRQPSVVGCVLGTPLTVNTSLALTNGHIDLGANILTLASGASIGGTPGSTSFVIADDTGGQLTRTLSTSGTYTYPIGDNSGTTEYTPATLTFAGGTYAGTVGVRVIDAVHPSNSGADFLTRYWQVLVSGVAPTSYTFAGTYISGAGDVTGTEGNCLAQCWNGSSWTDINTTAIGSNTCTVTGTAFPYAINEFSAQTASLNYRSRQTGDWSVASTWETSLDNVTWINALAAPTITANTITVLAGHTVTTTTAVTMDQVFVSGNLTCTGASIAVTVNNGPGTDLTINNGGVVTMSITGSTTAHGWNVPGTSIAVLSGGTYIHNTVRAVALFLDQTTFNTTSTMIYRGSSTLTPAVSLTNRTFGHLRFESTSGTLLIIVPSFTTTCTSNDFFIGSGVTLRTSSGTTGIFAVSGNFTNNGTMDNAAGFFNFTFSGISKTISGTTVPNFDTVTVTGSYTLSTRIDFAYTTGLCTVAVGGILDNGGENQITGSVSANVVVNGRFITRDAQGFTGTNAAIPTLIVAVGTSSTVEYGGPSQTITAFTTYNNVTVSGTGTKTLLTTPIVMNGDLNVNASTLLVNTNEVIEVKKAVNVALSGATFEIRNNGQLVQNDDIVNGANIYNGGNTGNIIYNRTASSIMGYDYVYWGSPVAGQDIATIYSVPSPGFKYSWNPTVSNLNTATTGTSGNWQTASGAMTPGKGYIVRGSSSYGMASTNIPAVFTGVPNNGQILTSISRGGNTIASQTGINSATVTNLDDNWNLVANPYPSAIDASSFLADNSNLTVNGFVWLWRNISTPTLVSNVFYSSSTSNYNTTDYIAYNSLGSNPSGFNGKIAAGQSFFISMVDGLATSQTVIFKNTMRKDRITSAINNNTQFYRNSSPITELEVDKHRIWLDLIDMNNEAVTTLIGYTPEATIGIDRMYDAYKNIANEKNIYSLAENNTLIIQGRPTPFDENDQVPIGVRIMTEGNYKIAIAAVDGLFEHDQPIYLEDKDLNLIYDLRQSPYSFSSIAGIFNDRFVLRFTNTALGNPDFGNIENSVIVAGNHGELTIKSSVENIQEVTVYDVLGRQLFFAKGISNTNFVTSKITMSQQTLIVKIKLENGVMISRKVIL
jgi:hypothetical protein